MNIVIISDTHAKELNKLPQELLRDIIEADAVIHAGDIGSEQFLSDLKNISRKLYAVKGNNDLFPLPKEIIETFENVKIALIHGDGIRGDIPTSLSYRFASEEPNIIIYGHTHRPKIDDIAGITVVNPGSPTKNRFTEYNSYITLDINDNKFLIKYIKVVK